jgi:very-short-patch-repair endonuclease
MGEGQGGGEMSSTIQNARMLRKNMTDAEIKLWELIRKRQILGFKFRKQAPIGPYIADFVCFARKLVIEIDGGQHKDRKSYDVQRTTWLESQGYEVIRFWNNDVLKDSEAVLEVICRRLTPPRPSPVNRVGENRML